MSRSLKRLVIIGIYLIIAGTIIFLITRRFVAEPTCFDGQMNQDEESVDCGGPCNECEEEVKVKKIVIEDYYVIYGSHDSYDVLVEVNNPNERYGVSNFKYLIELKNESGEVISSRESESFILPTESKYLVEIGLKVDDKVASATVSIGEVKWENFVDFEVPKVEVHNQKFGLVEKGTDYARAFGLMVNDSPFDFNRININVVVKDSRGTPIAVSKTDKRTVISGSEYEFTLNWPEEFPGGSNMATVDMQAEVNVFDNQNFMKQYASGGRLHELGQ